MASNSSNASAVDFDYYFSIFEKVSISSSVFLSIVAFATVIINGISLYVIYKDPLKCFRNPFSVFITGMLVSDFLTGLIVEPVYVALYVLWLKDVDLDDYIKIIRSSDIISAVTINTSFLTVLALAVAELIALRFPSLYSKAVKTRYAVFGIVAIWIYAILFAVVPEMFHVSMEKYFVIDLILHRTLITAALVIIYIIIYFAFIRTMRRHHEISGYGNEEHSNNIENTSEQDNDNTLGEEDNVDITPPSYTTVSNVKLEKDFLVGSIIVIAILLVTVWPSTIAFYVWMFRKSGDEDAFLRDYIALVFTNNILFLKFVLDPLIFVWRIPKYRKAIARVYSPTKERVGRVLHRDQQPVLAQYHQQINEDSVEEPLNIGGEREWSADIHSGVLEISDAQA